MRFCLVNPELAPFSGSGVGTYAAHMAKALLDADHEVHILTRPAKGLCERSVQSLLPGVHLHTLPNPAQPHIPSPATQRPLAVFHTLRDLHARHDFDAIEFADIFGEGAMAIQAKRTLGVFGRCVLAVRLHSPIFLLRELNAQHAHTRRSAIIEHLEQDAISHADMVLAPSHAILDRIANRLANAENDYSRHSMVHHNPLVPALLAPAQCDARPSRPALPLVLAFGRLEYRKGLHLLVDAACSLLRRGRDVRVRIIGQDTPTWPAGGSIARALRAQIPAELLDRFEFLPEQTRQRLSQQIARASVCCFPSLWENFSYACLEAMSAGATVVASDAGGFPEIIEPTRSGYLFKREDSSDLADSLAIAIDNPIHPPDASRRAASLCDPVQAAAKLVQAIESIPKPIHPHRRSRSAPPKTAIFITSAEDSPASARALNSPRAQSHRPHQILLAQPETAHEPFGTVADPVALHPSDPLDAAARQTDAPYVVVLDRNDVLAEEFLERCHRAIEFDLREHPDHPLDAITVHTLIQSGDMARPDRLLIPLPPTMAARVPIKIAPPPMMIRRRTLLSALRLSSEREGAWGLWDRLARVNARFVVIPEPLARRLPPVPLTNGALIPQSAI